MELSIEFFPPKSPEGALKLKGVQEQFASELRPNFYSVTFGAGGSTQEGTIHTVRAIHEAGYQAAPHLSCVGSSRENILKLLSIYKEMGVKRIVALRGDLPSGMGQYGEFHHANELVTFIRQSMPDWFHIEVAAYPEVHPQASSSKADLENFARKIKSGADSAITQYFFNSDAYFHFVDDANKLGVDVPIVPGIMPITSSTQLMRFSDGCGAEIPRWLRKRLDAYGDDTASIKAYGIEVVTDLCDQLLQGGAPGLHFYSLNQAQPTMTIVNNLKELFPKINS